MDEPPTPSLQSNVTNYSDLTQEQEHSNNMDDHHATFASTWTQNNNIETALAPSNLPLSKVQRAWDRRPQSPFSRKKVRFGKVWKRNNLPGSSNATRSIFGNAGAFDFQMIGQDSPMKAVKRMRVDEEGLGLVRDWDGRGSPQGRRIVTRSANDGELLELAEEENEVDSGALAGGEDEVEEEVSKLEVSYEDGRTEELEGEEELAQEDWEDEDESVTEEDPDGWDRYAELERMRQEQEALGQSVGTEQAALDEQHVLSDPAEQISTAQQVDANVTTEEQSPEASDIAVISQPKAPQADTEPLLKVAPSAIPEGFVSPVKPQRRTINQVRQANANRRRTLPVNFAAQEASTRNAEPSATVEEPVAPVDNTEQTAPASDLQDVPLEERSIEDAVVSAENASPDQTMQEADEWEDASDIEGDVQAEIPDARPVTPEPGEELIPTVENTPTDSPSLEINPTIQRLAEQLGSPSKLPSSPVGSITGPHPRLPLRRSPRRKSSSPLKKSNILPSSGKSHLVAFTPIKLPGAMAEDDELPTSPLPTNGTHSVDHAMEDVNLPQLARSSSAPPEEPQMSPRKPSYPRISDDTAILQAFLSRAAENKSGKRPSLTAARESFENRRNSDTVRHALASPAKKVAPVDVLGDLDPNSPSPRKQAQAADVAHADKKCKMSQDEDELAQDAPSPMKKISRRSGRSKKKPEVLAATTYSGPTKISVRGTADSVVLKKSEAQELAQLTRTNTRKNKGGSVLPPLRLTKMTKDGSNNSVESSEAVDAEAERLTKIKWSETLVAFSQDPAEPEVSMLTNELHGPDSTLDEPSVQLDPDMDGVVTAVPASETPSKPKLRRLKPPRTASTPAKAAAPKEETSDVKSKPAGNTRKRSRIATPAKPKNGEVAALLPDGVVVEEEEEPAPKKMPASSTATKKSAPAVSKLRAPAPVSTGLAQGKENSLIASPPKKRAKAPSSTPAPSNVKAFAPKLDFNKTASVAPSSRKQEAEGSENTLPGLASPAKKGLRSGTLPSARDVGVPVAQELPPSLGSPAKKKTTRRYQAG